MATKVKSVPTNAVLKKGLLKTALPKNMWLTPVLRDIKKGRPGSVTSCALAVCAKREYPQITYAAFRQWGVTFTVGSYHLHYAIFSKGVKVIECNDKLGASRAEVVADAINDGLVGKKIKLVFINKTKVQSLTPEKAAAKSAKESGKVRKPQSVPYRMRQAKALAGEFGVSPPNA